VLTGESGLALDLLGLRPQRAVPLQDDPAEGNGSWLLVMPDGTRSVLRRYHAGTQPGELAYGHAVLRHLAAAGWVVLQPAGESVSCAGRWYCRTRYVPGRAVSTGPADRGRPGRYRVASARAARITPALAGCPASLSNGPYGPP
jgi:Ser/Thr protein kinase RdoA (MazF antagonist)